MDLGIADKVVFCAGGSKGIGFAAARQLATEGCRVAVVARDPAGIDEAVETIRAAGGRAVGVSADLVSNDGVDAAVAQVTKELGEPDIVVGQTNDLTFGAFPDVPPHEFEKVFKIFTMSQIYLAYATVPAMRRRKWGRYIHIGSTNGKEAQLTHPTIIHNTVRPSTVAFLRVMANAVAADGVTVNVVAPGLTMTPTLKDYIAKGLKLDPEGGKAWLRDEFPEGIMSSHGLQGPPRIPMKRAGEPEEAASLIAYLASRQAGYITGTWTPVDGGKHAFTF